MRRAAYIGMFLFMLLFFSPVAFAEVVTTMSLPIRAPMEVTSPFGWRTHPIYGDQRYHSGCDLAGDYGDEIQAAASGSGADPSLRSQAWNDKKISAHHAIIPTRVKAELFSLSETEAKLYLMVATAYLAQFYPAYDFFSTKADLEWDGEYFIAKGKTVKAMGWRSLYKTERTADEENESPDFIGHSLPMMQEGDSAIYGAGIVQPRTTLPPSRFTPATLLSAMKNIHKHVKDKTLQAALRESQGIGTEATRAGIIETLQTRGFLMLDKKHLVPCEKAYQLCNVLPDDILFPDTTALWEQQLDAIKDGKLSADDFFTQQEKILRKILRQAQETKLPKQRTS